MKILYVQHGGARGVIDIIIENRYGDPRSYSEHGYLHFI